MDLMKEKNKFRVFSLIIIVIGIIMILVKGFNYGIDFTGGTIIEMNLGKYIEADELREVLDEYDEDASIVYGGENKENLIIKSTLDLSNDEITDIISIYSDKYEVEGDYYKSEKFEPLMGSEIKKKALLSTGIAIIGMLIYITIRFELNFGISAIIALVHDILIMISFYAIFRIPVNSSFIAAILTILGYSINDTIVIFDRIRENLKLYQKDNKGDIVNRSIKQSLRRTINTSITTLLAVVVIYIFGVEAVRILALPLLVGIVSGTYSSIFIASPLWAELAERNGN